MKFTGKAVLITSANVIINYSNTSDDASFVNGAVLVADGGRC